jgi:uncharacterized protein YwbE
MFSEGSICYNTFMKKIIVAVLIIFFSLKLFEDISYKRVDTDSLLKQKATKTYLVKKIDTALKDDNLDDAKIYINLAKMLHITLPSNLYERYNKQDTLLHDLKDLGHGFLTGDAKNSKQLAGAIASDFTVVGDIRDIKREGERYLQNKPYDEFVLGISVIGVGLTLTTISSVGSTAPLKVGASVLKVAKRTGKLTKSFTKTVMTKLSKTYDKRLLKKMDFKSINFKPIKPIFKNLNKIQKNTSYSDAIYLLKFVKNEKDLTKVTKLSQKYGKNTKAVFKVLGKNALKGAKKVLVYTKDAIYLFATILLGTLYILS